MPSDQRPTAVPPLGPHSPTGSFWRWTTPLTPLAMSPGWENASYQTESAPNADAESSGRSQRRLAWSPPSEPSGRLERRQNGWKSSGTRARSACSVAVNPPATPDTEGAADGTVEAAAGVTMGAALGTTVGAGRAPCSIAAA